MGKFISGVAVTVVGALIISFASSLVGWVPDVTKNVVAAYFPEHSVQLASREAPCPRGFVELGPVAIFGGTDAAASFSKLQELQSPELADGYQVWHIKACAKLSNSE